MGGIGTDTGGGGGALVAWGTLSRRMASYWGRSDISSSDSEPSLTCCIAGGGGGGGLAITLLVLGWLIRPQQLPTTHIHLAPKGVLVFHSEVAGHWLAPELGWALGSVSKPQFFISSTGLV